jgi:hypothetical protein
MKRNVFWTVIFPVVMVFIVLLLIRLSWFSERITCSNTGGNFTYGACWHKDANGVWRK